MFHCNEQVAYMYSYGILKFQSFMFCLEHNNLNFMMNSVEGRNYLAYAAGFIQSVFVFSPAIH